MIRLSLSVVGGSEAVRRVRGFQDAVKSSLKTIAEEVRTAVIEGTPVGDYPPPKKPGSKVRTPGHLKAGWGSLEEHEGGYAFSNPVPYANILEEGLYPSIGDHLKTKRGTSAEGQPGIFSSQAVGGMIGKLISDDQKMDMLADDFIKLIESYLDKL